MSDPFIIIHGDKWLYKDIAESVEWARKETWELRKWSPRTALVSRDHVSDYVGQNYDPQFAKLVEEAWTHDHCQICWWTIHESDSQEEGVGYTSDGHQWLCIECYEKFILHKA